MTDVSDRPLSASARSAAAKRHLIIFTTDAGFMMPTMSVIDQLLTQPAVLARADIIVYLVDIDPDRQRALEDAFGHLPIRFVEIPADLLQLSGEVSFNPTHVPHSTLARLSLGTLLPEQYEHVLYLDGDIQLLGDIAPLVEHEVAPGKIASVNEGVWMYQGDGGGYWRGMSAYLSGLGLQSPLDYFNAGILAFRRDTWRAKSAEALRFFTEHSDLCRFHDQSALNFVFNGRREVLSPLYNYISSYADLGLADRLQPRIVHFTGAAKPWFSRAHPWKGRFLPYYDALRARYPVLAAFERPKSAAEVARVDSEAKARRRKMMLLTPWRPMLRRQKLLRYFRDTRFAF
ncbi:glycosyltransferase family 8 protein [Sphingomonas crusticola]|uniref:glycosyltransferase family 8 protein n=1 Tax=Sphingomonas crusticola TaxID=1697973 RepID=UPI0013C2A383|nr:glycosyltransferase [Sphingomonas crusticola]